MKRRTSRGFGMGAALLVAASALAIGCAKGADLGGSAQGGHDASGDDGSTSATTGDGTSSTSTGSGDTLGTGGLGAGGGGSGSSGAGGACVSVSAEATAEVLPADIVIAVDTSGSMFEEETQVRNNLNAFASLIEASGIDVHVVIVADEFVCIPPPLGSGSCGGNDGQLPDYRHVLASVGSHDALGKILGTYPKWKDSLRPDSVKTFAVISDDDSAKGAADFTAALLALDPSLQGFKFDAIVASESPAVCDECLFDCGSCVHACCDKHFDCMEISSAEGKVYEELVQQTGGVFGDLCAQDFGPVFQDMGHAVVAGSALSCEYAIPAPPDGAELDPAKVNFAYTPSGAAGPEAILNVPGGEAACGDAGGWYYDDPAGPTKIIACPATCDALKADLGGKVDVLFGCETEIAPPQ